ncbi:hypothetical protein [Rhodococcus sp. 24CO]|uniref:hypothetical protein n=1 Tax=Rhodococcus sp. 24CO TaxID=3117460 RepID=UPI003D34B8C4
MVGTLCGARIEIGCSGTEHEPEASSVDMSAQWVVSWCTLRRYSGALVRVDTGSARLIVAL